MSQMIESFMQVGVRGSMAAQPLELEEAGGDASPSTPLLCDPHPLHAVKVQLQVCVGSAAMTLGELLSANQNEVLRLESAVDQPVDLLLDGCVVARGELMAVEGSFAVRITELPRPLRI